MPTADTTNTSSTDYIAIVRLQAAYGDAVTRRDWQAVAECFAPDAEVVVDTGRGDPMQVHGGAAFAEFVERAVERFEFFEFVPLNTVLDIDGDVASGRFYIQELRQDAVTHRFSTAYGLYTDDYVRIDDAWRFAQRHYRSLARTSDDPERDLDVVD